MSKAILISIKPKYVAAILNGKKTIEIRKSVPKVKLPIDVYIYCTKGKYEMGKFNSDKKYHEIRDDCCYAGGWSRGLPDETVNGQVVAKFTLNKVEHAYNFDPKEICDLACITSDELNKYAGGWYKTDDLFAWRIDKLKVLEPIKKLGAFGLDKAPQSWQYIEV